MIKVHRGGNWNMHQLLVYTNNYIILVTADIVTEASILLVQSSDGARYYNLKSTIILLEWWMLYSIASNYGLLINYQEDGNYFHHHDIHASRLAIEMSNLPLHWATGLNLSDIIHLMVIAIVTNARCCCLHNQIKGQMLQIN